MIRSSAPLVYILILNYCSLDDTLACLATVRARDYANLRYLVLDNASPDGSGNELAKLLPPSSFRQTGANLGYAGGNNIGFDIALAAGADYVFVVNPDVRMPSDAITKYVGLMEEDASISALNPIQLCTGDSIDGMFAREMFDKNDHARPGLPVDEALHWEVRTLFGAALFIRRSTLLRVGGFDPLYFAYWEEVDLCRRIRHHGGRLIVCGAAPVLHLRSYLAQGANRRRSFLRLKGMYLYRLKNPQADFGSALKAASKEILKCIAKPPESTFGWTRGQYLQTLAWIMMHRRKIAAHRAIDLHGAGYIQSGHEARDSGRASPI